MSEKTPDYIDRVRQVLAPPRQELTLEECLAREGQRLGVEFIPVEEQK